MLKRKFEITEDSTLFNDTTQVFLFERGCEEEVKIVKKEQVHHTNLLQCGLHQESENKNIIESNPIQKSIAIEKSINGAKISKSGMNNPSNRIRKLSISVDYKDRVRFSKEHDRGKY